MLKINRNVTALMLPLEGLDKLLPATFKAISVQNLGKEPIPNFQSHSWQAVI